MLFETDVINAVCTLLENSGYVIVQRLNTKQHGDDIIATKQIDSLRELRIEAKGATSSRKGSERYGLPFDTAQVGVHVAEAFYRAAAILSRNSGDSDVKAGIALPDNENHRTAVEKIKPVISKLGISVFWVDERQQVLLESTWKL